MGHTPTRRSAALFSLSNETGAPAWQRALIDADGGQTKTVQRNAA